MRGLGGSRLRRSLSVLVIAGLLLGGAGIGEVAAKKVNVNQASKKELEAVPGISPQLAKLIVQYRKAEGPIENWDEILLLKREAEIRELEKNLKIGPAKKED